MSDLHYITEELRYLEQRRQSALMKMEQSTDPKRQEAFHHGMQTLMHALPWNEKFTEAIDAIYQHVFMLQERVAAIAILDEVTFSLIKRRQQLEREQSRG